MSISEFISKQAPDRQELLRELHAIIVEKDKTITPVIGLMMGKEMIMYNAPGTFKYGLSSVKNYMSLHLMPMYVSGTLYAKYKSLLKDTNFQKGCINFKSKEEMPLKVAKELIADCSKIDLLAIRENYLRSKSKKA